MLLHKKKIVILGALFALVVSSQGMMFQAQIGNANAQYQLSKKLFEAVSTYDEPAYFDKSLLWLKRAAKNGSTGAQYDLGQRFYYGIGVMQDKEQALQWIKKSALQGHVRAQSSLGSMYVNGYGIAQDYDVAAYWLQKAADAQERGAQYQLAVLYEHGLGVPKDLEQAEMLYLQACAKGLSLSCSAYKRLYK